MPIEMIEPVETNLAAHIKVIGVGGGGGNAIDHMIARNVGGVEFICANTDAQVLRESSAHRVVQLGANGLGAGGKPDKGREAALAAEADIRAAIEGAHMLFITAGMGGGTGTGAAPVVARIAKEMGMLTVGVVTKPFDFEGKKRMESAEAGLAELEANVDSLIVVLNDKLLETLSEDATQEDAFGQANDVLRHAVGGIAEVINVRGVVNLDFEDVRTIMCENGRGMMGTGLASGADRARVAAEQAVSSPLLEGVDLAGARGVLVLVSAARGSLKLAESKVAMNAIRGHSSDLANVIYGTAYDESLGDQIRVTVIATGLARPKSSAARPAITVVQGRTGTDGVGFALGTGMASLAAGAGGASSPSGQASVAPAGAADGDFGGMSVPSVWRTRTQASSKVDALSSSGMEDFEIPAFLRKQAD